jgi:hypothetical protein
MSVRIFFDNYFENLLMIKFVKFSFKPYVSIPQLVKLHGLYVVTR